MVITKYNAGFPGYVHEEFLYKVLGVCFSLLCLYIYYIYCTHCIYLHIYIYNIFKTPLKKFIYIFISFNGL